MLDTCVIHVIILPYLAALSGGLGKDPLRRDICADALGRPFRHVLHDCRWVAENAVAIVQLDRVERFFWIQAHDLFRERRRHAESAERDRMQIRRVETREHGVEKVAVHGLEIIDHDQRIEADPDGPTVLRQPLHRVQACIELRSLVFKGVDDALRTQAERAHTAALGRHVEQRSYLRALCPQLEPGALDLREGGYESRGETRYGIQGQAVAIIAGEEHTSPSAPSQIASISWIRSS